MAEWKQWVKNGLSAWQRRKYNRLLEKKTMVYDSWIRQAETERYGDDWEGAGMSVHQVPYEACRDYLTRGVMEKDKAEVVLFVGGDGRASNIAKKAATEYFAQNEGIDLAYGDEDVMGPDGIRYTPWFKPDWSPDTFLSFFYFGNVFAVRMRALRALTAEEMRWIWQPEERGGEMGIYRLCYVLAVKCGGFQARGAERTGSGGGGKWKNRSRNENENGNRNENENINVNGQRDRDRTCGKETGFGFPIGHMDEVLFHAKENCEIKLVRSQYLDRRGCPAGEGNRGYEEHREKLSVVIPSKDNAMALKNCIRAVQGQYAKREKSLDCEIIVVDNGSAEEVREDLAGWLASQSEGICYRYLYRKMPFHFSQMCNIGARAAAGDVLLFLNDDVEMAAEWGDTGTCREEKQDGKGGACRDGKNIGQTGSGGQGCLLERLYNRAKRSFTGAAGVKLYYPDSRRIQHAGVVNLRLGPVHKLQFKEDDTDYYYGWNRRERNVAAVTGACLAVEKKKYWEAGGFPEELPVAFNDVDLCFTLFERGYYNVVLQDTVLYHYESMSRGNDDDREKLERLLEEKDRLYARHPRMYGSDPFYHKYLAGDMLSTGFELKADYDEDPQQAYGKAAEEKGLTENAREDACVMVSLEYAGAFQSFRPGAGALAGTDRGKDGSGVWKPGKGTGAGKEEAIAEEGDTAYLLQGYSFVAGSDNALYDRYLIFRPDGGDGRDSVFSVKAEPFVRKDVEGNLPDQTNVGMTGFCVLIGRGDLPSGTYQVGVMAKDKCSGQKLYTWTNRYLTGWGKQ